MTSPDILNDSTTLQEQLKNCFKEMDGLIKQGNYSGARNILETARRLDPVNPFVNAFADRITHFEKRSRTASPHQPRHQAALTPVLEPLAEEIDHKHRVNDQYEARFKELERQVNAAHADMLERERTLLAKREQKLREEYRLHMEKMVRDEPDAPPRSGAELQRIQTELLRKLDQQLSIEREIFSRQYAAEHNRLQQAYLAEQGKLQGEHRAQMAQHLQNVRRQETEHLQERWTEVHKEVEKSYQGKFQPQPAGSPEPGPSSGSAQASTGQRPQAGNDVQAIRRQVRGEMEKDFLRRMERFVHEHSQKMDLLGFIMPQTKQEAINLYRKRLKEYYAGGLPSIEKAKYLMECKELLELTFDEHEEVETDVRLELYVEQAGQILLKSGKADPASEQNLEELKKRFHITPEESSMLEPYFFSSLERLVIRGRILVADDEPSLRDFLADVLTKEGYQVLQAPTVAAGLETLKRNKVDLIISDLKFGPNQPDGFAFFTEVQKNERLGHLPFLLLSSMIDDVYIKTGVQLGVDNYLTKPVDTGLLLAIVDGKIKRYRSTSR